MITGAFKLFWIVLFGAMIYQIFSYTDNFTFDQNKINELQILSTQVEKQFIVNGRRDVSFFLKRWKKVISSKEFQEVFNTDVIFFFQKWGLKIFPYRIRYYVNMDNLDSKLSACKILESYYKYLNEMAIHRKKIGLNVEAINQMIVIVAEFKEKAKKHIM